MLKDNSNCRATCKKYSAWLDADWQEPRPCDVCTHAAGGHEGKQPVTKAHMTNFIRRFVGLLLVLAPVMLVLGYCCCKLGLEVLVQIGVAFVVSVLLLISVVVGLHLLATPNR